MLNQHLQPLTSSDPLQITIIGFGNIGRQILSQLLEEKFRSYHINVMDPSPEVKGSIYDLMPSGHLSKNHKIFFNNDLQFSEADFIFYAAGQAIPKGEKRSFGVAENIETVKSIFNNYTPYKVPLILVITNPQEQICLAILRATNLPQKQIIGLGTLVDSVRFEYFLTQKANVLEHEVSAWMIGEHGDYSIPVLSHTFINHRPVAECLSREDIDWCVSETKNAANSIKETQGASYFTAAKSAIFIMNIYLSHYQEVLPLAVFNPVMNMFISIPVKIGKGQINIIRDFKLNDLEQEELNATIQHIALQNQKSGILALNVA